MLTISFKILYTILFALANVESVLAHTALKGAGQHLPKTPPPDVSQFNKYLIQSQDGPKQLSEAGKVYSTSLPKLHSAAVSEVISSIPSIPSPLDVVAPSDLGVSSFSFSASDEHIPATPSNVLYSPTTSADAYSTTTTSTSSTSSSPTSLTLSTSAFSIPQHGPGLVIPTSTWDVQASEALSSMHISTAALTVSPSATAASHNAGGVIPDNPNHRTPIIIGCVLIGLLAFSMITCALLNMRRLRNRLFARDLECRLVKDMEKLDSSSVESNSAETKTAGHPSSLPAWLKLPSQISPFHTHRDSLLSYFRAGRDSLISKQAPPQVQKSHRVRVLDIVTDFPRSRFSITSSDYTHSLRSIDSINQLEAPIPRRSVPLLTPQEFFSLASSTTLTSRHSRTGSAPVFGRHRREAGLSLALHRARQMEREEILSKPGTTLRVKSMSLVRNQGLQQKRTHSIAVVGNGEWC
ncbi:hypothetical protein GYMLUDRAFT_54114 [Collybiopsis luxurians FD-317 M1]|nr:hypothetical protein GYMLUDRAFT_54114 [Collybiopsis luxurians FD-317 M1]